MYNSRALHSMKYFGLGLVSEGRSIVHNVGDTILQKDTLSLHALFPQ